MKLKEEAYVNFHFNVIDTWTKGETNKSSHKCFKNIRKTKMGERTRGPQPKKAEFKETLKYENENMTCF